MKSDLLVPSLRCGACDGTSYFNTHRFETCVFAAVCWNSTESRRRRECCWKIDRKREQEMERYRSCIDGSVAPVLREKGSNMRRSIAWSHRHRRHIRHRRHRHNRHCHRVALRHCVHTHPHTPSSFHTLVSSLAYYMLCQRAFQCSSLRLHFIYCSERCHYPPNGYSICFCRM